MRASSQNSPTHSSTHTPTHSPTLGRRASASNLADVNANGDNQPEGAWNLGAADTVTVIPASVGGTGSNLGQFNAADYALALQVETVSEKVNEKVNNAADYALALQLETVGEKVNEKVGESQSTSQSTSQIDSDDSSTDSATGTGNKSPTNATNVKVGTVAPAFNQPLPPASACNPALKERATKYAAVGLGLIALAGVLGYFIANRSGSQTPTPGPGYHTIALSTSGAAELSASQAMQLFMVMAVALAAQAGVLRPD